ncbi:alpha/beta fold hydrolase [Halomarina salina]|uniref:Alpha/beta fold hydrolase n=1 Tax=Halomarina salina TaxID=1872699 RepID=A0ABD5RKQ8_9EURY|nr:alpha/beta fold hydrolase [Halomarina salina]
MPRRDDQTPTGRSTPSRRTVLRAGGVLLTSALAGCGSGSDPTTTQSTTAPPTTSPPTSDGTDAETTTPDSTTGTPDDEALRTAAEQFVGHLAAGEYDAATEQFAPALAEQVDAATLETVWSDLQRQYGAFVGIEATDLTTVQGYDAAVVSTRFAQGLVGLRVVLDDEVRVAGFQVVPVEQPEEWSPPEYVDTGTFETTSVSLAGPDSCTLPGELAVPVDAGGETAESSAGDSTDGPSDDAGVPGVVILGGSGPTDLDGSIGPNRPYRDLAYGLATDGVASLRYTKRTAVCSVDPATLTVGDEYTEDALTAIDRVRETPGVDPDRIVVLGHSLGASLAPRVAARAEGVAGVAMLAPPGRPLHRLLVEQTRYLAELDGTVTDEEQARLDEVTAAADRIDDLALGDDEVLLGAGKAYWSSLAEYDAFETARSLSVPLFLAYGGRDYQVTATDRERWADALDGDDATVTVYDDLNHLFVPGEGQSTPEEYTTLGHVAPAVVSDLSAWVEAR